MAKPGKTDAELKEEEELQLVLALSKMCLFLGPGGQAWQDRCRAEGRGGATAGPSTLEGKTSSRVQNKLFFIIYNSNHTGDNF